MSDFTGMTLILATSSGKVTRWMKFVFLSAAVKSLTCYGDEEEASKRLFNGLATLAEFIYPETVAGRFLGK